MPETTCADWEIVLDEAEFDLIGARLARLRRELKQ